MSEKERLKKALSKDDAKLAMKEALKEWLDEKLALFGAYSLVGIFAGAMAALAYVLIKMDGWHK